MKLKGKSKSVKNLLKPKGKLIKIIFVELQTERQDSYPLL